MCQAGVLTIMFCWLYCELGRSIRPLTFGGEWEGSTFGHNSENQTLIKLDHISCPQNVTLGHFISPFLLFHCVRGYPPLLWHDCWNGVYERTESRQKCGRIPVWPDIHMNAVSVCLSVRHVSLRLHDSQWTVWPRNSNGQQYFFPGLSPKWRRRRIETRMNQVYVLFDTRGRSPIGERDYSTYFIRRESNFMVYVPWKKVPQRLSCTS